MCLAGNRPLRPLRPGDASAAIRSIFVSATIPCRMPSKVRISRCSRVCGITPSSAATTKYHAVHSAGPGNHGFYEIFMAGHVDDAHLHIGDFARGKPEIDRHAPLFFFLQPVGFAPGKAFYQRGFSVIDMTRRAKRDIYLLQIGVSITCCSRHTPCAVGNIIGTQSTATAYGLSRILQPTAHGVCLLHCILLSQPEPILSKWRTRFSHKKQPPRLHPIGGTQYQGKNLKVMHYTGLPLRLL